VRIELEWGLEESLLLLGLKKLVGQLELGELASPFYACIQVLYGLIYLRIIYLV